jgi:hypothetical protein
MNNSFIGGLTVPRIPSKRRSTKGIGVHERTVNKERPNLKIITCDVNCKIKANKCVKLFMERDT